MRPPSIARTAGRASTRSNRRKHGIANHRNGGRSDAAIRAKAAQDASNDVAESDGRNLQLPAARLRPSERGYRAMQQAAIPRTTLMGDLVKLESHGLLRRDVAYSWATPSTFHGGLVDAAAVIARPPRPPSLHLSRIPPVPPAELAI
jgi:hypothetical protein